MSSRAGIAQGTMRECPTAGRPTEPGANFRTPASTDVPRLESQRDLRDHFELHRYASGKDWPRPSTRRAEAWPKTWRTSSDAASATLG